MNHMDPEMVAEQEAEGEAPEAAAADQVADRDM
jgi:hypothetical protein